jgi:hypothetical protein
MFPPIFCCHRKILFSIFSFLCRSYVGILYIDPMFTIFYIGYMPALYRNCLWFTLLALVYLESIHHSVWASVVHSTAWIASKTIFSFLNLIFWSVRIFKFSHRIFVFSVKLGFPLHLNWCNTNIGQYWSCTIYLLGDFNDIFRLVFFHRSFLEKYPKIKYTILTGPLIMQWAFVKDLLNYSTDYIETWTLSLVRQKSNF